MKKFLIICIALTSILGCRESKNWRKTVKENVDKLTETVDQAAKAIPGERWQRILEAVHSDDENVRNKAIEYLNRVTGIRAEKKYSVSVLFKYDQDTTSIEIDVFQDAYLSRDKARERLELNKHRLGNIRNFERDTFYGSYQNPLDIANLKDTLVKNIGIAFDHIVGAPRKRQVPNQPIKIYNIRNTIDFYDSPHLFDYHSTKPHLMVGVNLNNVIRKRQQGITKLVDNILLPINQNKIPINPNVRRENWNPLTGKGYLYILVNKKDFDRVKENNFRGEIQVHETDNVNNRLYSSTPVKLKKHEFSPEKNEAVIHPYTGQEYVWYAHDMSGSTPINIADIERLGELLKEVEELQAKRKKIENKWW